MSHFLFTQQDWTSAKAIDVIHTANPPVDNKEQGMTVVIMNSVIQNSSGEIAIDNDYAQVIINGLEVSSVTVITLLQTINSGVTDIEMLMVTKCSMGAVTLTTTQGQLQISSSVIFDNDKFSDVFVSTDEGTNTTIDGLEVTENTRILDAWTAVFVDKSSMATVSNSLFSGNIQMGSAIMASDMGRAEVFDTRITSNNGVSTPVPGLDLTSMIPFSHFFLTDLSNCELPCIFHQ